MIPMLGKGRNRQLMNIIAATKNAGKIREISEIFSELGVGVVSQQDAGLDIDTEETGDSFEKNALIKARAVALLTDDIVMADDSGLCIEALDGRPGIFSARYAGENGTDRDKIQKVLTEMEDKKNRKAKFVTAVAVILPDGREFVTTGEVKGSILREPIGENGFGYDPIFYCDELEKTFAQATDEEKNSVSHRGRALRAMYKNLSEILREES